MKIYRVTLKEPATPHEPIILRAPSTLVAENLALVFLRDPFPAPQGSPQGRDRERVTCVEVHDSGYPEKGPMEILEPVEYREWREIG